MCDELPDWWIRHVALERLDCRDFFTEDNWVEYNLDLSEEEEKIIEQADVLISGPHHVYDDIDPISLTVRGSRGMAGGYFEPIREDTLSEGLLSSNSFFLKTNSIEDVDPATTVSERVYTRHDDELYQWEIAESGSGDFAGQKGKFPYKKNRNFYVSNEFREMYYRVQRKQAEIKHIRNQVFQDEISKEKGRGKMQSSYKKLRNIYQEYYPAVHDYSAQRKADHDFIRKPKSPPTLTGIDRAVEIGEDGSVSGKTSIEALTYRQAVQAGLKARKAYEDLQDDRQVDYIEDELEQSAIAIVLAIQSAESYINGMIQENLMDYWENMERMQIRSKWQTAPHLITGEQVFGPESDAFGKFKRAVYCRNQIVHYKKDEEEFIEKAGYGYLSPVVEQVNSRDAYRAVSAVSEMITDFADARNERPPGWVGSDMWIYGRKHGQHDNPLDFDYWLDYMDELSL